MAVPAPCYCTRCGGTLKIPGAASANTLIECTHDARSYYIMLRWPIATGVTSVTTIPCRRFCQNCTELTEEGDALAFARILLPPIPEHARVVWVKADHIRDMMNHDIGPELLQIDGPVRRG